MGVCVCHTVPVAKWGQEANKFNLWKVSVSDKTDLSQITSVCGTERWRNERLRSSCCFHQERNVTEDKKTWISQPSLSLITLKRKASEAQRRPNGLLCSSSAAREDFSRFFKFRFWTLHPCLTVYLNAKSVQQVNFSRSVSAGLKQTGRVPASSKHSKRLRAIKASKWRD